MKHVRFVVFDRSTPLRLRPSVSVIPTSNQDVWELFQSNTRRIKHIRLADISLAEIIYSLNGQTLNELVRKYPHLKTSIESIIPALMQWCMIEYISVADKIESSKNYRTLNFIADYIPCDELFDVHGRVESSNVLLVGVGGVGSWIAIGLAQLGVKNFILCDPDIIKKHNLNRSLFDDADIGVLKTTAICNKIKALGDDFNVIEINQMIGKPDVIDDILGSYSTVNLVINASDHPNVDTTSKIIFEPCMRRNITHIIAGGYNLHLSLIGPTIIPNKTACLKCIEEGLKKQQDDDFASIKKLHRKKRNIGNLAPLAGISATFTINEALRVLCQSNKIGPIMTGRRGEFNFLTSKVAYSEYEKLDDCCWCGDTNRL